MSTITGVVNDIKSFPAGATTMYSLIVEGERYGTGSYPPKCNVGDTVTFEVAMRGQYKNVAPRSLKVVNAASPAQQAKAAVTASKGGFNDPARQETISKQAAANTAIAFLNLLQTAGAIPGVAAKTTPEQKYDIIEALFEKKLGDFYSFATGNDLPDNDTGKTEASPYVGDESGDSNWQ